MVSKKYRVIVNYNDTTSVAYGGFIGTLKYAFKSNNMNTQTPFSFLEGKLKAKTSNDSFSTKKMFNPNAKNLLTTHLIRPKYKYLVGKFPTLEYIEKKKN